MYERRQTVDVIGYDESGTPLREAVTTEPVESPLALERRPEPCAVVLFGVTGDLASRKLIPALYDLACHNVLPRGFTARGLWAQASERPGHARALARRHRQLLRHRHGRDAHLQRHAGHAHYVQGEFGDPEGYKRLRDTLAELDRTKRTGQPDLLSGHAAQPVPGDHRAARRRRTGRGRSGRHAGRARRDRGWVRVVIEKPFGSDLESARSSNAAVRAVFDEHQVYRIDHYLAKETVQNILVFRFANGIFEPIWNRRYIDHVQITAAETLGVEHRGAYYEEAGALRDMIQNHLLQLVTMTAMEPPVAFDADAVRDEKAKVLHAVRPIPVERVDQFAVRGQYVQGTVDGQVVPGYRQEERVAPDSTTETFAAVKFLIDNWRWQGVPFYVRTGKRLPRHVTEIAIQFKRPPYLLFRDADLPAGACRPTTSSCGSSPRRASP